MTEARQALAFVVRRQGRDKMAPSEWANVLSLELGWMTPAQAKRYVKACHDAGLLAGQDVFTPTFEAAHVEVPRGFRPDPERLPVVAAGDPFHAWLARVAAATNRDEDDVMRMVAVVQEEFGGLLEAHAALLVLAADHGLDVTAAADEALADLTRRRAAPPAREDTPST
jgi:hypothetical protein